jgi:ankyrin repeat protein
MKGKYSRYSPLHIACDNGHVEVVIVLLNNGAALNIRNEVSLKLAMSAFEIGRLVIPQSTLPVPRIMWSWCPFYWKGVQI